MRCQSHILLLGKNKNLDFLFFRCNYFCLFSWNLHNLAKGFAGCRWWGFESVFSFCLLVGWFLIANKGSQLGLRT